MEERNHVLYIHAERDILTAMEITKRFAIEAAFSAKECTLLQLVTEEACMNALEYGHRGSSFGFEVNWLLCEDSFVISVRQRGGPFELPDPSQLNQGSRGRGLMLIQGIMDDVRLIQTEGNLTLWMHKNRWCMDEHS